MLLTPAQYHHDLTDAERAAVDVWIWSSGVELTDCLGVVDEITLLVLDRNEDGTVKITRGDDGWANAQSRLVAALGPFPVDRRP